MLNETPPDKLEAALAPILDVDGALKFLALDVALVNSDGYWTRASDYSIYQDEKGKFHVIPHDMNEGVRRRRWPRLRPRRTARPRWPDGAWPAGRWRPWRRGRGMFGGGGADLDPLVGLDDTSKPLRSKLLAVPALRERYLAYVRDIADNVARLEARSTRASSSIRR